MTTKNTKATGLSSLLTGTNASIISNTSNKTSEASYENICIRVPAEIMEFLRDYRYSKIITTGNVNMTQQDVYLDAFECLKENCKIEIKQRPDTVRETEKRGKKKNNERI